MTALVFINPGTLKALATLPPVPTPTTMPLAQLVDESTFTPDGRMGLTGQRITGRRVVLEWVARSWLQPRGKNRFAPNSFINIRTLENGSIGDGDLEAYRAALVQAAKDAAIGYLAGCDVTVTLADRTVTIAGRATLIDGSKDSLAITLSAGVAVVKFGGALA